MATLADELRRVAASRPDAPALLSTSGEVFRFADLVAVTDAISDELMAAGVPAGARVATRLEDGLEAALLALAVPLRHVLVPLDARSPPAELARQLEEVRPYAVAVGVEHPLEPHPSWAVLSVERAPASGALRIFTRGTLPSAPARDPGALPDAALLIGTSGTAGHPSFAELTHGNVLHSVRNIARGYGLGPDDVRLNVMPLFHVQGQIGGLWAPLLAGGAVVQAAGFDAWRALEAIETHRVTWFSAVPTMHRDLLTVIEQRGAKVSHQLRFVRVGSDALDGKLAERLRAAWGVPVVGSYGMTESSSQITVHAFEQNPEGSCGRVVGPEVRIASGEGGALPPGESGEIWIRGPNVVARYANGRHPERWTEEGWFCTGDTGHFDAAGFLHLEGRVRDQIRSGGEPVIPGRVEAVLQDFPSVLEAAVAGVPHPRLGQEVGALVVPRAGTDLDVNALRRFAAARLLPHQLPRRLLVVPSLPRGPTGKLRRREAAEILSRCVSSEETASPSSGVPVALVTSIWCSVLGIGEARPDGDFFDLGGGSLAFETLLARIEEQALHTCTLAEALPRPTLAGLLGVLRPHPHAALPEIRSASAGPVLWCLPPALGSLIGFAHLARTLVWPGPIRAVRHVAGLAEDAGGIAGTAARVLARIDELDGQREPYLLGYSLGGLVAFEMARILEQSGRRARFVGLIDSQLPSRAKAGGLWKHFARLNELSAPVDLDGAPERAVDERMWRDFDRYFDRITLLGGDRTGTPRQRTLRMLGLGSEALDRDPEAARRILRAFRIAYRQATAYEARPIQTEVDYLSAGLTPSTGDPSDGWAELAPCRVHHLQGHHMEVLSASGAASTAAALSQVLDAALSRAGD